MWTIAIGQEWLRRRLGDAMVLGLLALVYLLTGCDVPGYEDRDRQVAEEPSTTSSFEVSTVAYGAPLPDPAPPVATGPVSYEQAEQAFREKQYDEAVALFSAYIERKPSNAWGHYMLGLSAWKAGDNRTAESAYEIALSLDPRHEKSLLGLSRVLIEEGRADEALQEIEFAAEIDPSSAQVFRLMGRAYHELGRTDDAVAAYLDAIALDDTDVWALNNVGYLYIQTSQHSEAIGPLARAVELAPDVAMFQNNLGIALERIGYAGSAAEAFRAAVAADATYVKAQVNLARVEARGTDLDIMADLATHAQRFVDEVTGWRDLVVGEFEVDTIPPDSSFEEQREPEPNPEPEVEPDSLPELAAPPDSTVKVEVLPDTIPPAVGNNKHR